MQTVLVVGAGTMGAVHVRAYQEMGNVKLAGIVDIRKEKAEALVDPGESMIYTSFDEAVRTLGDVDIIDICLPTYLHKEFVIKAADVASHVICEKPISRHMEDAEVMIDYCEKRGVQLFVGHVVRFFPEYAKIKQTLDAGAIGQPGVARASRVGGFPRGWNDWYANLGFSGGPVLDVIIHDFDFLRWCFGEVERVFAKSLIGRQLGRMDYDLVTLRFQNGTIAHVEGSWAHQSFKTALEIAGDKGIVDYDSTKEKPLTATINSKQSRNEGVTVPESPLKESPHFRELKHFVDCIENDRKPLVSPHDAKKAIEISLAALESIETGKPVTLNS